MIGFFQASRIAQFKQQLLLATLAYLQMASLGINIVRFEQHDSVWYHQRRSYVTINLSTARKTQQEWIMPYTTMNCLPPVVLQSHYILMQ